MAPAVTLSSPVVDTSAVRMRIGLSIVGTTLGVAGILSNGTMDQIGEDVDLELKGVHHRS